MQPKHILIVEQDSAVRELIAFALHGAGFEVVEAADGASALQRVADRFPDLMLVEWLLPDFSGLDLTREFKRDADTRHVPIIIVTTRAQEADKVRGLNSGADDYITKPFSPRELLARIHAALRRSSPHWGEVVLTADRLTLDTHGHRVKVDDRTVRLGPTEYRLLHFFMSHPERAFARRQLLDRVWGGNVYVEERTVDVSVRRLRKALAPFGSDRLIHTVRGAGYRFSTQPD